MWFKVIDMIEKLEEEIKNINSELAYLNSRIDTLECYQSNNDELEELINKSNTLEEQKSDLITKKKRYEEMINGRQYTIKEIEKSLDFLNKSKEILENQISKSVENSDVYHNLVAEMNSVNKALCFFEKKLEEIKKQTNKR